MSTPHDLQDDERIREFIAEPGRIAVIGMKPSGAARSIPLAMASKGFEIVPVNPKYDDVAGFESYPTVSDVPGTVDIVDIFRRSEAIDEHVDQILKMDPLPGLVWFQLGIRNNGAAKRLAEAGIPVVQDRCLKVEYNRLVG